MHWVDFHFLLVIRHLSSLGLNLPVHLLVSDSKNGLGSEGRNNTKRTVEAVLGTGAQVHWQSETFDARSPYGSYAQAKGFDGNTVELIQRYAGEKKRGGFRRSTKIRGVFIRLNTGAVHLGYAALYQNRCIYLYWHRHAETMESFLLHFLELNALVISTPDLKLGGALGNSSRQLDPESRRGCQRFDDDTSEAKSETAIVNM
jgi:hypothetical protein